jgi:hypothetical protein
VLVETGVGIETVIVVPLGRVNIPPGGFRAVGAECRRLIEGLGPE